ncbi:hypothetical protein Q31b_23150 [Novipirellula aureliae]|uniref:Uncharacterized protein n=1 Tax=Novipirellula aureliae TaxID=2527966 RepID=A0A5C6E5M8_9BACT|nr:response regulator [Novipirellula aureliae]TWU43277.1 hypothetical protein Q31b_23150 [Novipirellula aureliae]
MMTSSQRVRFTQSCPTCGRRVEIRASLLGCTVACQHCHAEFTASAQNNDCEKLPQTDDLLARVEIALRRAEEQAALSKSLDAARTESIV